MSIHRNLMTVCFAAVFALGLAACSSSSDDPPDTGDGTTVTQPSPYETAKKAIAAAETAEDAQAAYDAVKEDVTAAEGEKLQMAVDERKEALAKMAREASQKEALMAAGMIDTSDLSTAEAIAAANMAIALLQAALDAAADVSDADKAMYQERLDAAKMAVQTAQASLDTEGRRDAQQTALMGAKEALDTALAALSGTPTQEQIDAANTALAALNTAIAGGEDLTDTEKADYQLAAAKAEGQIAGAEKALMAQKKADDDKKAEERKKADDAMMATAMKLHMGIETPSATAAAAYDTDGNVEVTIGTETAVDLTEDKKATVADNHGWMGKKYTRTTPATDGMYEAVVYSNVGKPTEGAKFNDADNGGYTLIDGMITVTTTDAATRGRVASPSFDQSAGVKRFPLPSPNPNGVTKVTFAGSYHGVAGNYTCTPGGSAVCAVRIAANNGFELGTVPSATDSTWTAAAAQWMFKPNDPNARVTETKDTDYASYGWWIHKSADGKTFTASAFVDDMGSVSPAAGITDLRGTATYSGGAAGKYSLYSATGGTNDAGHFTARATLEADFNDDMITGTIDNFKGADGMSRDWSVELMKSAIGNTGLIRQSDDDNSDLAATDPGAMTKWTIGGEAADADGSWIGALKDNDANGVPKVGTGTFYSEYSTSGKMVGGFGVTQQ